VNQPTGVIETGIASSRAVLPAPPDYWSYSTLEAVTACPRRYCLERASYPDLGDRTGYPTLPSVSTLLGDVVHGALETVVKALTDAGVESPHTEEAAGVLRGLGGLTAVVENETSRRLAPLAGNLRLSSDRQRRIALDLQAKVPDARAQVQTYLSRTKFVPSAPRSRIGAGADGRGTRGRFEFRDGSHAEADLTAEELGLHGRVDLLIIAGDQVDIIDYKTGAESDGHADQLRLYALLWGADGKSNPKGLGVGSLTAAYRDHDSNVDVPSAAELDNLAAGLGSKIVSANSEITSGSPSAKPSPGTCHYCTVRHLCADYWKTVAPKLADVEPGNFFDYEGVVGEQNGQRSWWLVGNTGGPELLLRTTTPTPSFAIGDRVRFLGLRRDADPEVTWPIGSLTVATEVFLVESS
jgi:hypothetical protein